MFPIPPLMVSGGLQALSTISISVTASNAQLRYAGVQVYRYGQVRERVAVSSYNVIDYWYSESAYPLGDPSLYECGIFSITKSNPLLTINGPDVDSYHALGALQDREWYIASSFAGTYTFSGTLKIREIANPSNEVTAAFSVTLTVTS